MRRSTSARLVVVKRGGNLVLGKFIVSVYLMALTDGALPVAAQRLEDFHVGGVRLSSRCRLRSIARLELQDNTTSECQSKQSDQLT